MMGRRRWRTLLALFAAVTLVASACGDDDDEASDDETTETTRAGDDAEDQPVEGTLITATDYEFDVPDELHASAVEFTFRNSGQVAHEMGLVKLGDTPDERFFEAMKTLVQSEQGAPIPDFFFNGFTGIGDTQPGEQTISTISLSAGDWLLFCALDDTSTQGADGDQNGDEGGGGDGEGAQGRAQEGEGGEGGGEEAQLPPHFELGMHQRVTVTGSAEPTPPEGFPTVTARDYEFDIPELEGGEQEIAVVNEGPDEAHHGVLLGFGKGVTPEQAEETLRGFFTGGPPGGEEGGGGGTEESTPGRAQEDEGGGGGGQPEEVGFSYVFSPGYGGTLNVDLKSGETYAFACFINDREGGAPHAVANDMITGFTVS